ncbi:hypothetical protein VD659_02145 [Herbiconiux sp. 11R-BC]|uniref:hypothetical protein n=1 Tax=Herbiconiux sp. 11R-BC TaxID=3111637 RepID=UPI003C03CE10
MPGNPWPHDMQLTIENSPHALHELLWIREAWGLQPEGEDLPPLLSDTPAAVEGDRPGAWTDWQEAWPELWGACVAHAGIPADPTIFDRLTAATVGSSERAELLAQLVGPSWRERFGDDALTTEFNDWEAARFEELRSQVHTPAAESPEWKALDALVPAWRAGLTKLVLIPCRGSYTRPIGSAGLLLTEETRNDPARYQAALRSR